MKMFSDFVLDVELSIIRIIPNLRVLLKVEILE